MKKVLFSVSALLLAFNIYCYKAVYVTPEMALEEFQAATYGDVEAVENLDEIITRLLRTYDEREVGRILASSDAFCEYYRNGGDVFCFPWVEEYSEESSYLRGYLSGILDNEEEQQRDYNLEYDFDALHGYYEDFYSYDKGLMDGNEDGL